MKAQPFFPDLLFPKPSALPPLPGNWHRCGRIEVLERSEGVEMSEGFCVADHDHGDGEIVFRVCAPKEVAEVQIWAGFRAKDRHHRYVVALRGGITISSTSPATDRTVDPGSSGSRLSGSIPSPGSGIACAWFWRGTASAFSSVMKRRPAST